MYLKKYDLSGRTAFITGGGRGIGLATAAAGACSRPAPGS